MWLNAITPLSESCLKFLGKISSNSQNCQIRVETLKGFDNLIADVILKQLRILTSRIRIDVLILLLYPWL